MVIARQCLRVLNHGAQRSLRGYVRTIQESYRCPLTWLIRNIHPSEYWLGSTIWIFVWIEREREREREIYADIRVARTTQPRLPSIPWASSKATHTLPPPGPVSFEADQLPSRMPVRRNIDRATSKYLRAFHFTPCSNDPPSFISSQLAPSSRVTTIGKVRHIMGLSLGECSNSDTYNRSSRGRRLFERGVR